MDKADEWTQPTFSSLSVSWLHMKDTSCEKDGRLPGSRAQHLHIILYLQEKVKVSTPAQIHVRQDKLGNLESSNKHIYMFLDWKHQEIVQTGGEHARLGKLVLFILSK